MNVTSPTATLTEQVEALIAWAARAARRERRKYRVNGIKTIAGVWYYQALPEGEWHKFTTAVTRREDRTT